MEVKKDLGFIGSSEDGTKVADSVKGLILTFSALIILIAGKIGLPIAESNVGLFAQQIGIAIGALWTLFGFLKKGAVKVGAMTSKVV